MWNTISSVPIVLCVNQNEKNIVMINDVNQTIIKCNLGQ